MRLLLAANLSPRGIATPLRTAGQDVLALAADPAFEGFDDTRALELAADVIVMVERAKGGAS